MLMLDKKAVAQPEFDGIEVPPGWVLTTVGSVMTIQYGRGLTEQRRDASGSIPVYGSNGVVGYHSSALVDGPCIVIGRKGSAGAVHLSNGPCWPIDTTYYVQPPDELSLEYAYYVLGYLQLGTLDRSTAIPGLNRDDAYSRPFPLPPLAEQRRIVAAIETQFTRLDAGVAALKALLAKLKRYRAAVLKAAVEGRLTEEWRAAHPDVEPAEVLLQRILQERRQAWEQAELEKYAKAGKTPPKGWQSKYIEPPAPNVEDLPIVPEGWRWARMEQITQIQGGIQKQPSRAPKQNPYPFLRVANVSRGCLDLSEVHHIELFRDELETLRLLEGDLLIVEGNGSKTEIGRSALWNGAIENCVHQNHIIRARPIAVNPKYLDYYWNSPDGNNRVSQVAGSTSGLYTLSIGKIARLPVPIPPLAEQEQIVAEVDRRLSVVSEIEPQVEVQLKRSERLRQSILSRAFAGKLVPQDPNDEPAEALLARIRCTSSGARPQAPSSGPRGQEQSRDDGKKREARQLRLI